MARPPPDPALVKKALEYCRSMSPQEAAEQLKREGHRVGWRSIYEWSKGKNGAMVATPTTPAALKPKLEPEAPRPRVVAPAPPAEPGTLARRLWYVERDIQACSDAIAQAHADGAAARTASLQDQLRKWLEMVAELQPVVVDKNEEEKRWRAAADSVIAKIKQGMKAAA